jgi:hypothetical protein
MGDVRSIHGEADDVQTMESEGLGHTELWYWGFEYQLSFNAEGLLDAKNHY